MIADLKYMICSYLSIGEMLKLVHNTKTREKIYLMYNTIPDLYNEIKNDDLESVKYLITKSVKVDDDAILCAVNNDNLDIMIHLSKYVVITTATKFKIYGSHPPEIMKHLLMPTVENNWSNSRNILDKSLAIYSYYLLLFGLNITILFK